MSKNVMLDTIIRVLPDVPPERQGVLYHIINKVSGVHGDLWEKRFSQVLREGVKPTIVSSETSIDTIVRVDRSIQPTYPDWVMLMMHPELENTGLVEYDLSTIDCWLHRVQRNGRAMKGDVLYEYLKEKKMLVNCLSLRDGEEIQKKGIAVFQKFFQSKAVFLWKSVVRSHNEILHVPYLFKSGREVEILWSAFNHNWLEKVWAGNSPALRFTN